MKSILLMMIVLLSAFISGCSDNDDRRHDARYYAPQGYQQPVNQNYQPQYQNYPPQIQQPVPYPPQYRDDHRDEGYGLGTVVAAGVGAAALTHMVTGSNKSAAVVGAKAGYTTAKTKVVNVAKPVVISAQEKARRLAQSARDKAAYEARKAKVLYAKQQHKKKQKHKKKKR